MTQRIRWRHASPHVNREDDAVRIVLANRARREMRRWLSTLKPHERRWLRGAVRGSLD